MCFPVVFFVSESEIRICVCVGKFMMDVFQLHSNMGLGEVHDNFTLAGALEVCSCNNWAILSLFMNHKFVLVQQRLGLINDLLELSDYPPKKTHLTLYFHAIEISFGITHDFEDHFLGFHSVRRHFQSSGFRLLENSSRYDTGFI